MTASCRRTVRICLLLLSVRYAATGVLEAAPPNPPQLVSPANGASNVPAAAQLKVKVKDPDLNKMNVTFYGRATTDPVPPFTLVVLPDTQYYPLLDNGIFEQQTQWILDNRESRNIVYVAHLGDCVEHANLEPEWIIADQAMSLIENPLTTGLSDGIPWGIAPGNHDQDGFNPGTLDNQSATTLLFNQYFGLSRFVPRSSYYGDHFGTNNDNHYDLFSASGMDFLVIYLEYDFDGGPLRDAVLSWADGVLKAFPSRHGIVVSHYLLTSKGVDPVPFSAQGQITYDALKDNPNLFLMLSGHLTSERRRSDTFAGSTVQTVLSNYQQRPNGGNGWLRIMEFRPDEDTIHVQTYSPYLNAFETDPESEFDLTYAMTGVPDFQPLGTVPNVADNKEAAFIWNGRKQGTTYEWRVVVDDGTAQTQGSIWKFTSNGNCGNVAQCEDGDVCTDHACTGGKCQTTVDPTCCNTAAQCEDGSVCTVDSCSLHLCQHGPIACNDQNPCTDDSCDPLAGCLAASNDANTCGDSLACTGADHCYGGSCVGDDLCATGLFCESGGCTTLKGAPLPLEVGGVWRFFKGTVEPPANWAALDFHDSSWAQGSSGFGYGDGDDATVLSDMQGHYRALYIRRTFEIADPSLVADLTLAVDYDDAFVAYLNGVEVARSGNILGNPPSHNDSASPGHEAGVPELFSLAAHLGLLVPGVNVLALQGHNNGTNSADFSLIPELFACSDGDPCTADVLEAGAGCAHYPDPGASCDDGQACTVGDSCDSSGVCTGVIGGEPSEVLGLAVGGEALTALGWTPQGAGMSYDIVSGSLVGLALDGGVGGAACVAPAVAAPPWNDPRPSPPQQDGYYYLIRARSGCAVGPYGVDSAGQPEVPGSDCP